MKLVVDLHVHSVASGHAFSTMSESARAASEKGLELIAFSDHGPALPGGAHQYHFWNMRVLPDEMFGVRILKGAEANIINNEGELDLEDDLLKSLDVVLIGFHPSCGYKGETSDQNTETLIRAMRNPLVHVVVHPGNPWFPIHKKAVVEASKENNVLLEINNSSFVTSRPGGEDTCREIAKEVKAQGLSIIVASDAHFSSLVGEFDAAIEVLKEIDFPEEHVLNTSTEKTLSFLKEKRF